MHKRIREIRLEQPLKSERTQEKFAKQLNISRSQLSYYESGNVSITDRSIKDICAKFGVNEEWLRTGKGRKYQETAIDEMAFLMGQFVNEENEFKKKVISTLLQLDSKDWATIEKIIDLIKQKKQNN